MLLFCIVNVRNEEVFANGDAVKKIYNAVVDYYLENPGRMRTRFTCPVLHPPAEKGEILRCFLAEVETRDWLQQSKKYSQEGN